MRGNELLDKMELVDLDYVETADKKPMVKRVWWVRWGVMVACVSLIVVGGVLLYNQINYEVPKNLFAVETIENMEEISSVYDGTLLAENLILSNAEVATIELIHLENAEIYDISSWDMLSITADYNDYSMVLNCSFHGQAESDSISEIFSTMEIFDTIQYGDVQINLYQKEPSQESEYVYGASFEYVGVFYELLTLSNDPDSIYEILEMVISPYNTEDANGLDQQDQEDIDTFTNIMGFDGYCVRIEESSPNDYVWHYYAEIEGETQCIVEAFGHPISGWWPEAYSVDLDDDGMPELICNCSYGDGAERVIVYRNNNGVIEKGFLVQKYLERDFNIDITVAAYAIIEKYDPVENAFYVTNYANDGSVRTATVKGVEYLEFLPYVSSEVPYED